MAEAKVKFTADTQQAEQALNSLKTTSANLSKELGEGAGKSLGQLEGGIKGVASAAGLSAPAVQGLGIAFKALTGAINPATLAISAIALAVTGITWALKRQEQNTIAATDAQNRYEESISKSETTLRSFARLMMTDAERAADDYGRALEIMARRGLGSFDDIGAAQNALAADTARLVEARRQAEIEIADASSRRAASLRLEMRRISAAISQNEEAARALGRERQARERNKEAIDAEYRALQRLNQSRDDELKILRSRNEAAKRERAQREEDERAQQRALRASEAAARAAEILRQQEEKLTKALGDQANARRALEAANRDASERAFEAIRRTLGDEEQAQALRARLIREGVDLEVDARQWLAEQAIRIGRASSDEERARLQADYDRRLELFNLENSLAEEKRRNEERLAQEAQDAQDRQNAKRKQAQIDLHNQLLEDRRKYEQKVLALTMRYGTQGASIIRDLAENGWKAAVSSTGEALYAEGIQRGLQGLAMSILGQPGGPAMIGVGAAMTAAGAGMIGAGGRGRAAAPSAPTTAQTQQQTMNQQTTYNYNIGMVGDPREFSRQVETAGTIASRQGQRGVV